MNLSNLPAYVEQLEEQNKEELEAPTEPEPEDEEDAELEDVNDNSEKPKKVFNNELEELNNATIERLLALFEMCKFNVEAVRTAQPNNFLSGKIIMKIKFRHSVNETKILKSKNKM